MLLCYRQFNDKSRTFTISIGFYPSTVIITPNNHLIKIKKYATLSLKEALGELLKSSYKETYCMKQPISIIIPSDEARKEITGKIESTDSNNVGPRCSCTACGSCRCTPCK